MCVSNWLSQTFSWLFPPTCAQSVCRYSSAAPSFHLSCHCQELRSVREMKLAEQQLFRELKIFWKNAVTVLLCGPVLLRQKKAAQGERENMGEKRKKWRKTEETEGGKKANPLRVDCVNQPPVQPFPPHPAKALQRWMKPSDGTFLDLCGKALPGALVHARTHRSLQRRVYEMPLGGEGGGLQPHVTAWCSRQRNASFKIHDWYNGSKGR